MKEAEAPREMTHAELLALPVSFSLDVANRALSLGRTTGFALAKQGQYPIRVLRLGRQYRCTRYDLLRYLGVLVDDVEGVERTETAKQ
ncbi:integrase [Streptomyces litchfieldiae]|uniref:Integrase n=1 Tax=Streptomyces litchfieldiae TaxID=3075543 RepID=A0ABU2MYN6_9ACTN|nr:integrase [Streptomyces sp. DSM 44938]MDT0346740.1 integrase [Streptomyces sp. DSM 44938]